MWQQMPHPLGPRSCAPLGRTLRTQQRAYVPLRSDQPYFHASEDAVLGAGQLAPDGISQRSTLEHRLDTYEDRNDLRGRDAGLDASAEAGVPGAP
jgi:hypothetical protein